MIVNIDAARIGELVSEGQFWWVRPDGDCYATDVREPAAVGDIFLLEVSEAWLEQFDGDWAAVEELFVKMLEKINGEG